MKNNYYENVDRYFQTAAVSDDSTPHLLGGTGDLKTPNQYWGDDFGKFSLIFLFTPNISLLIQVELNNLLPRLHEIVFSFTRFPENAWFTEFQFFEPDLNC